MSYLPIKGNKLLGTRVVRNDSFHNIYVQGSPDFKIIIISPCVPPANAAPIL